MPAIVMEVKTAERHPNASALHVYGMEAPGFERLQIIANAEELYAVGDRVAVALVDSILKDGTKIKPTKLRGLLSYGLALEQVTQPVGHDLSATYCQQSVATIVSLQKWPSIELLSNVRRSLNLLGIAPKVTYRAKVKLDGTNAGVQICSDGRVAAQSRTQVITPKNDNMGFAHWVSQNLECFTQMVGNEHITLFGEWCGKGIQKRTSISQIDRKIFVLFAMQLGGVEGIPSRLIVDPDEIAQRVPQHPDIFVLPFWGEPIVLDFGHPEQVAAAIARINQVVASIEQTDPWVQDTFGKAGLGEGLVLYVEALEPDTLPLAFSDLMFKAKGEKHQVVKTRQPVQIDPEVAKNIDEFVQLFITPARLEQGLSVACNGQLDMQQMGAFLKWLVTDVQKESAAELEASQLTWKAVNKAVMNAGRSWYREQVEFQSFS